MPTVPTSPAVPTIVVPVTGSPVVSRTEAPSVTLVPSAISSDFDSQVPSGSASSDVPNASIGTLVPSTSAGSLVPGVSDAPAQERTEAPVACPASRQEALLQTLNGTTSTALLLNASSPQGQAFAWLLNNDTTYSPCAENIPQRYALAVLNYGWQNFATKNNTGWLSASSECEWQYVECDPSSRVVVELVFSKSHFDDISCK
jgi:hypothetical protein